MLLITVFVQNVKGSKPIVINIITISVVFDALDFKRTKSSTARKIELKRIIRVLHHVSLHVKTDRK